MKRFYVNSRKHYIRAQAVNQHKAQRVENPEAQIFNRKYIFYGLNKILHAEYYNLTISVLPPPASIAFFAEAEKAWALTSSFAFSSPLPKIFTRSLFLRSP